MIWEISLFLKFWIIGVVVNTSTVDYKHPVGDCGICCSLFRCNCLKNENSCSVFLFHLWNLHQILNIYQKKKIVIANVLPKLQTVKDFVRPLDSQHLKGLKHLRNLGERTFIVFFLQSEGKWFANNFPYWVFKS